MENGQGPADPIDAYDREHGAPEKTPDAPKVSPAQEWSVGGPVQDDALPARNLRDGGAR